MRIRIRSISLTIAILSGLGTAGAQPPAHPTIYIASDSTAAIFPASSYPQMGWGMVLACSLDNGIAVDDRAEGGRSSRSFRAEGWLDKIDAAIKPGDTLLIQFGHNDAAKELPERYSSIPVFKEQLQAYLDVAHRHQAVPVLITPLSKAKFAPNGVLYNSLADYAQAVRDVAAATHTPLIDLNADSQAALLKFGPNGWQAYYLPDATHPNEHGARWVASLIARRLAELGIPASSHVHLSQAADSAILGGGGCPR